MRKVLEVAKAAPTPGYQESWRRGQWRAVRVSDTVQFTTGRDQIFEAGCKRISLLGTGNFPCCVLRVGERVGQPPGEGKGVMALGTFKVASSLPADLGRKLLERVSQEGTTESALIRKAVELYLDTWTGRETAVSATTEKERQQ